MDTEEVLDYVMATPCNTNRAVLKGMLKNMSGGGDSGNVVIIDAKAVLNDTTWEVTDFGSSYNELKELILAKKYIVVRLEHKNPGAPYAQLTFLPLSSGNQAEFPSGMGGSTISFQAANISYSSSIRVNIWNLYVQDNDSIQLTNSSNLPY